MSLYHDDILKLSHEEFESFRALKALLPESSVGLKNVMGYCWVIVYGNDIYR